MKLLPVILIASLLASCGGGGDKPQNDEIGFGGLSELFGDLDIKFIFSGSEAEIYLHTIFNAEDLFVSDEDGSYFLYSSAKLSIRESPGEEIKQGSTRGFACSFINDRRIFCALDLGGSLATIYVFDRINNGSAQGFFEQCDDDSGCVDDLFSAPDGRAFLSVTDPKIVAGIDSKSVTEMTDLLPYLQYLKQGSPTAGSAGNTPALPDDDLSDIVRKLREIRKIK